MAVTANQGSPNHGWEAESGHTEAPRLTELNRAAVLERPLQEKKQMRLAIPRWLGTN